MHCGLCTWSTALAFDRTFTHIAECAAGLQIDLCIDLIKVQNSAIAALPGAFTGGGALEWQEGVSGSSMDSQNAP